MVLAFAGGLVLLVWVRPVSETGERRRATAAIASIRTLHTAEVQYYSQYAGYGELRDLGPDGADLISPDLAEGLSMGYRFNLKLSARGYVVTAMPLGKQDLSFYSDETMIIRKGTGTRPARAGSPELK